MKHAVAASEVCFPEERLLSYPAAETHGASKLRDDVERRRAVTFILSDLVRILVVFNQYSEAGCDAEE
jgi:hypothetical protein